MLPTWEYPFWAPPARDGWSMQNQVEGEQPLNHGRSCGCPCRAVPAPSSWFPPFLVTGVRWEPELQVSLHKAKEAGLEDVLPSQGEASLFLYPIPRKGHQQCPLGQCSLAPRALCKHQALSASPLLSPNQMSSSSSGAREWDLGANSSTVQWGAHCNAGWDSVLFSSAFWRGRR